MHILSAGLALALLSPAAPPGATLPSQIAGSTMPTGPETLLTVGSEAGFDAWAQDFIGRAAARGIRRDVLQAAFASLAYDPGVIVKDRNQGEFVKTIWDYLDKAVSEDRVANGLKALAQNRDLLDRIEAAYGVEKEVVVAIWGLESSYGANRGNLPLIRSLASLAYDGRRGAFFEDQLMAALEIIQGGNVAPANMTGSWAGAMGHTQFMPTSYLAHAVDFTGDGRRDIWSDDPADALASTAAYLARSGWVTGRLWGAEVTLPAGFDIGLTGDGMQKTAADWAALGVRAADGGNLPDDGPSSILLPAGAQGAAFIIYPNFRAIERYNAADAYVIAVGHLSDRLKGGSPIRAAWPRADRALQLAERVELQERLTSAGFDTGGADGKVGPRTIAAVKAFQRSIGMVPDGYASLDILRRLRG